MAFFPAIWVTATMCFGSKSACFWGCPKFYGFTWYGLSVVATRHLGRILFSSRKTPLLNPYEFTCLSCVSPQSLLWGKSNTGSTGWGPACLSDSELVRIHNYLDHRWKDISFSLAPSEWGSCGAGRLWARYRAVPAGTLLLPVPAGFWHPVWVRSWMHVS